jgi:hypothetical protein
LADRLPICQLASNPVQSAFTDFACKTIEFPRHAAIVRGSTGEPGNG